MASSSEPRQSIARSDYHEPELEVTIGTCFGCGSMSINPLDSECCCEGIPGLTHVVYLAICGRLLVGQGDDTYDPMCARPAGHQGRCMPKDEVMR
jgi:hypothetical protein